MQISLDKYRQAATGVTPPRYVQTAERHTDVYDPTSAGLDELWSAHDNPGTHSNGCSLLDIKIEIAKRVMRKCSLCEWKCRADRVAGEIGFCEVGADSYIFYEQILCGEEAPVIPSHEVFLSGCNMRCKYCYSWQSLENTSYGKLLNATDFADTVNNRRTEGAVNLNIVGGGPTIHLLNILLAISSFKSPVPIVWNSNFYMSTDTMGLLDGIIDLYLGDFKYGNNTCASEIGRIEHYYETVTRNLITAESNSDIIVRHLLLPGHVECCFRPIAQWISRNMPNVPFNLMLQYTPFYQALDDTELSKSLTSEEIVEANSIASSFNLNMKEWNQPLNMENPALSTGTGGLATTVIIRPDGQVTFMHLHSEFMRVIESLETGGRNIG